MTTLASWGTKLPAALAVAALGLGLGAAFFLLNHRDQQTLETHKIMQDERKEVVSKKLRYIKGVVVYKDIKTPEKFLNSLSGKVAILMYSDGCPSCTKNTPKIVNYSKELVEKGIAVIAVNDGRKPSTLKLLQKKFYVPNEFSYPTSFIYDLSDDKVETNYGKRYMYQTSVTRDGIYDK